MIYEFDFEIGEVESSVIIAVELVSQIEQYFVLLTLLFRVQELVDQSVAHMTNLVVARNQLIEGERNLITDVQISQTLIFVRYKNALNAIIRIKYDLKMFSF